MLLMKPGPAFQETWNVPRGVACALPGGPGSARTGPKTTLPADWSQPIGLARSTPGVGAAGQGGRAAAVSAGGTCSPGWGGCVGGDCGADAVGCGPAAAGASHGLSWLFTVSGVARGAAGRGEARAAEITTTEDAAAT